MGKKKTRENSTGTVYKRGRTYQIELTLGRDLETGRRIRRTKGGFATKREALEYIAILRNEKVEKKRTYQYYADMLFSSNFRKLSASKQTAYRISFEKLDKLRYVDLKSIDMKTLQTHINNVAPTYYTAMDIKVLLSHIYKLALADEVVTVNLSSLIDLPKLEEHSPIPFTNDEVSKFWQAYENGDIFWFITESSGKTAFRPIGLLEH